MGEMMLFFRCESLQTQACEAMIAPVHWIINQKKETIMLRSYQEQCEKSDLWKGLTGYLTYMENDEGVMLVTTQESPGCTVSRPQKCKLSENPQAHKMTIGSYIHDLKRDGKSNPRLDELGYISGIPNLDPQLKWENALEIILKLIREDAKTTDVDAKTALWKRVVDRLIGLEDLVSYSLLKRKLEAVRLTGPIDEIREVLGVERIYKEYNAEAEMRKVLQDPVLTYNLSARRFDTLCGFFPEIKTMVFADPKAFLFVTKKFSDDYVKLINKELGTIFKLFQPLSNLLQSPQQPQEEIPTRVPMGLGEFGGLH